MANRKLVMGEHEGSVLVDIIQNGCDPVVKTLEGTLEDALATVPQFLTEAQEKWHAQSKHERSFTEGAGGGEIVVAVVDGKRGRCKTAIKKW